MAKISSRGYRKIDPLFRRATWAGVKSAALCATRRSTLQLRKGLRDTKSWDSAQTRVDFLCTNLLESAHLPAVAHWSEMRHTHHQFGPPQFPHSAASSHFSQRAEMKQKGEKRERRQIESGWRAGRPADAGTPGGAISRGRAPDTPAGPEAKCRQIKLFVFTARTPPAQLPTALPLVAFAALICALGCKRQIVCTLCTHRALFILELSQVRMGIRVAI